jgi:hypothetical protein
MPHSLATTYGTSRALAHRAGWMLALREADVVGGAP